jgi:hypothetical protein
MALVRAALSAPAVTSIASLANSLTAGGSSAAISVGVTGNIVDHQVQVTVGVGAITPSPAAVVNLYVFGSIDGTTYSGTGATNELIDGTDKAVTLSPNGTEGIFLGSIPCLTASAVAKSKLFSIAQAFGGILPAKYVIVAQNSSTLALTSAAIAATELSYT